MIYNANSLKQHALSVSNMCFKHPTNDKADNADDDDLDDD